MSAAQSATRAESRPPPEPRAKRGKRQIQPINLPVMPAYQDDSPASWLAFISRATIDPAIDTGKLDILVRMRREIIADEARHAFNIAMAATQAEMVPVVRDADNRETHSKYAKLETIDAIARPIYTRHGFVLSYNSEPIDGPNIRIVCEVSHTGRHSKHYALEAAWDTAGPKGVVNKTPMHGMASSTTYLRRYLLCMIFNIVLKNQDEDGNLDGGQFRPRVVTNELYALLAQCSADPSAVAVNEAKFLERMGVTKVRRMVDADPADQVRFRDALMAKRGRLISAKGGVQ